MEDQGLDSYMESQLSGGDNFPYVPETEEAWWTDDDDDNDFDPEDDPEDDPERDADRLLEQQELEDFEQADEYFGCSAEDMF